MLCVFHYGCLGYDGGFAKFCYNLEDNDISSLKKMI